MGKSWNATHTHSSSHMRARRDEESTVNCSYQMNLIDAINWNEKKITES